MLTIKMPLLGVMVEVDYLYHPPTPEQPASYASGGEPGEAHWAEIHDVRLNGVSIEADDIYLRSCVPLPDGTSKYNYISALDWLMENVPEAHIDRDGW